MSEPRGTSSPTSAADIDGMVANTSGAAGMGTAGTHTAVAGGTRTADTSGTDGPTGIVGTDGTNGSARVAPRRSLVPMVLVFLVSLAPIVGAIVMYLNPQWWPDDGRSYGTLITPQRAVPAPAALGLTTLDGKPFDLATLKGRWVLVVADDGDCGDDCARKLFITRNVHASQGKNVDRAARIWLITDDQPIPQRVLDAYQGTIMLRADPAAAAQFLLGKPAGERATPALHTELNAPIWVIDPLGHLMLQFPGEADPVKVRDDFRKLLRQSRIG